MKIEIKSIFGNWKEVTKQQAKDYISFVYKNITLLRDGERIRYIEEKRLRGITYEQLFK